MVLEEQCMCEKNQVNQTHYGSGDNIGGNKYIFNIHGEGDNITPIADIKPEDFLLQSINEFSILPMLGIEKELRIENIFVTLTVSSQNMSGEKINIDTKGVTIEDCIDELYINRDLGSPHRLSLDMSIPLHNILLHKNAVVLGEPGAGKTTLLKRLLIDICKGFVCIGCIPVFLKLTDVTMFNQGFIYNYFRNKYPNFYLMIVSKLEQGEAVLFLDGFDEVLPNDQQIIANEISTVSAKGNRIFLSCRTTVFPRNVLSSDFKLFECLGFNIAQRKKFISNWFSSNPDLALRIEKKIANNYNTFGLSRNPLLLSLIALQFEMEPQFSLPKERIRIYIESVKALIVKRKYLYMPNVGLELKMKLLERIAFHMMTGNVEVIAESCLSIIIREWSDSCNLNDVQCSHTMQWVVNSGILQQQSSGQFKFLHLTLQEALTANFIASNCSAVNYIKHHIGIPKWEETVRLTMSLLKTEDVSIICDFLENESVKTTDKKQFYIIMGRYTSDFPNDNYTFFKITFNELVSYLFDDRSYVGYNDIIVSFASICNSHPNYLIAFIDIMSEKLNNITVLFSYINILRLSPSSASISELVRLFNYFNQAKVRYELVVEILGHIIEALTFMYDDNLWEDLYYKYLKKNELDVSSHLSAITAISLGRVQSKAVWKILECKQLNNSLGLLDLSILYKYENYRINKKLFVYSFSKSKNMDLCCLLSKLFDIQVQFNEKELDELLENCIFPEASAYLLCNHTLYIGKITLERVKATIESVSDPLIIRCAALENYLMICRNEPDKLRWAIAKIEASNLDEYYIIAINMILRIPCNIIADFILQTVKKETFSDRIIYSLARLFSSNTLTSVNPTQWLLARTKEYSRDHDMYLMLIIALARYNYPFVCDMINLYLENGIKNDYQIMSICKALAYSNNETSANTLLRVLDEQTDINIIGEIIVLLGQLNFACVEDRLIQYLDENNWPANWPSPLPVLKQGEQRPTDMRKLNLILVLKNKNSERCIPIFQAIMDSDTESSDVRYAASIAIKNMRWEVSFISTVDNNNNLLI